MFQMIQMIRMYQKILKYHYFLMNHLSLKCLSYHLSRLYQQIH